MLIELRKLSINKALSEETTCYSAEIWIDGKLAFHASNRGHGGADFYRQAGSLSEAEVDTWLKANAQPRLYHGVLLEPTLELKVGELIDEAESMKTLRRRMRTAVLTIEDGQVFTYPLRGCAPAALVASLRGKNAAAEILNDGDEALHLKAVRLLLAADDAAD